MDSEKFTQDIKDLIRSYFPDVLWIEPPLSSMARPFDFGSNQKELTVTSEDVYHFSQRHEAEDENISINDMFEKIKSLRFFKTPKSIYWRCAEIDTNHYDDLCITTYQVSVRFSLGY